MKRSNQILAMVLMAVFSGLPVARAELVGRQSDSIFDVDGLMVDTTEPEAPISNEIFRAQIKQYPLMDVRKPIMPPRPSRIRAPAPEVSAAQKVTRANVQAADTYSKQKNWPQALAEIQQALELDPENMLLIRKAAAYAALARNFVVADDYFQKVLRNYPDSATFLSGRAGVLIRLLRLKEADELVQKALVIDPSFLSARFNRLCIQIARGDADIPESGWELLNTDNVVELANWLDADRQDYVKALKPEGYAKLCGIVLGPGTDARLPEIVGSLNNAGAAFGTGRWAAAIEELSKVKSAGVRAVGIDVDIGRCLYEKGDKNTALAHFKALADRYPKDVSVLYDYAYVLINMDSYGQAVEVLDRVCALNPQYGQAAFALACCHAALGQMNKAWPILTRLASSHAAEMPDWLQGNEPYQEAIRKDPRYPELQKSIEAARQGTP